MQWDFFSLVILAGFDENDLYDAYQECTDEHGNTIANSKEYKKYKLNKSLYIYLFEYLVQKNYREMTHGKA